MVDLHLFMSHRVSNQDPSRPMCAPRRRPRRARTRSADAAPRADSEGYSLEEMTPADVHYGAVPRELLDPEVEQWKRDLNASSDLQMLVKVKNNAEKAYVKVRGKWGIGHRARAWPRLRPRPDSALPSQSRPNPSRRSVARAKGLPREAIHPLLLSLMRSRGVDLAKQRELDGCARPRCSPILPAFVLQFASPASPAPPPPPHHHHLVRLSASTCRFLHSLSEYRPKETVMETKGTGPGDGGQALAATLAMKVQNMRSVDAASKARDMRAQEKREEERKRVEAAAEEEAAAAAAAAEDGSSDAVPAAKKRRTVVESQLSATAAKRVPGGGVDSQAAASFKRRLSKAERKRMRKQGKAAAAPVKAPAKAQVAAGAGEEDGEEDNPFKDAEHFINTERSDKASEVRPRMRAVGPRRPSPSSSTSTDRRPTCVCACATGGPDGARRHEWKADVRGGADGRRRRGGD